MPSTASTVLLTATLLAGCVVDAGSESGDGAVVAAAHPRFANPHGRDAAYPIVLAHGFNASPIAAEGTLVRKWVFHDDVVNALRGDGHRVYVAHVRPYAGVPDRAQDLAGQVEEALKLVHVEDQPVEPGQPLAYYVRIPRGATALHVRLWGDGTSLQVLREDGVDACTSATPDGGEETCSLEGVGGQTLQIVVTADGDATAWFGLEARIDSKVNIIAHSMGGLDARYMISALGGANRVASLTTISTPHTGSKVANFVLDATQDVDGTVLNELASILGGNDPNLGTVDLRGALQALHLDTAAQFNRDHAEGQYTLGSAAKARASNGVYYQSWAGVSSWGPFQGPNDSDVCKNARGEAVLFNTTWSADWMDPLIAFAGAIVGDNHFVSNDGLVSVESAKWGDFQGCIPADHIDEIGQGDTHHSEFDPVSFYRTIAFQLAADGY